MTTADIDQLTGNLGTVREEDIRIFQKVPNVSIPLTKTSQALNINAFGRKRVVTISGIHTGAGYDEGSVEANLKAFVTDVEAWVNSSGTQNSAVYTTTLGNTFNVICINFQIIRRDTAQGILIYTMSLFEGTAIL